MSTKYFTLSFALAVLFLPQFAHAQTLPADQLINSATESQASNGFSFGDGWDGYVSAVTLSINNNTGSPLVYNTGLDWSSQTLGLVYICEVAFGDFADCGFYYPEDGTIPVGSNIIRYVPYTGDVPGANGITLDPGTDYLIAGINQSSSWNFEGDADAVGPWNLAGGTFRGVRTPYISFNQPAPPDPATTEFNEVLNYIPSTGVSISTGVIEVGAVFSIPSPEFIEYIGYRIYSPSNAVLYDATTTPSVAGLYEISTNFNFSSEGVYQGHAYFAQDFGGTIWEVDNPSIQQILVDVEEWTISPGGQFSQNPATTSTTTLPNLTLDCGDGFVSSVCNLIARLVIPSANSIGLVQSSFSGLMNKAPFSFFTESKRILDAFKTGSSSTGGTLTMVFYGESVPIISTSTAAAVGMDTTQLNFLKFIMTVGLWIMLAWFLYWRIASIFGV